MISYNSFSASGESIDLLARKARSCGFGALGLFSEHAFKAAEQGIALEQFEISGLYVYFAPGNLTSNPALDRLIQLATTVFDAPLAVIPTNDFRDIDDFAQHIGPLLDRHPQLQLLLEPISPRLRHVSLLTDLKDALQISRRFPDRVDIVLDLAHVQVSDILALTPSEVRSIRVVHLCDLSEERDPEERVLPGEGILPVSDIVDHLRDRGFTGIWEVEVIAQLSGSGSPSPNMFELVAHLLDR